MVLIWTSVVFMTIGSYSGLGRHYDTLTVAQQSTADFWHTLGDAAEYSRCVDSKDVVY